MTMRGFAGVIALTIAVAASGRAAEDRGSERAVATFAGGCFWGMEEAFDKVAGVLTTTSGYTGGRVVRPTYEQVSSGGTGHVEAVQVTYDPARVSYDALLEAFWHNIDPLDDGGQFCDRGEEYRTVVFFHTPEQKAQAEASRARVSAQLGGRIVTQLAPAAPFYSAEGYHQDFYKKNPVQYRSFEWNCGRAQRLEEIWRRRG